MTVDQFKKELIGLKGDVEILLSINCDGDSYRKLTSVEKGKIVEGDQVSVEIPEVTNKKVLILY